MANKFEKLSNSSLLVEFVKLCIVYRTNRVLKVGNYQEERKFELISGELLKRHIFTSEQLHELKKAL